MDQNQPTSGAARDMGSRAPHGDSGRTPSLSPPGSDLDGLELESLRASRDHAPPAGSALEALDEARSVIQALLHVWPADSLPPGPLCVRAASAINGSPPSDGAAIARAVTAALRASDQIWSDALLARAEEWINAKTGGDADVRMIAAALVASALSSAEQVEVPSSRDELLDRLSQLEAELKRRDEALRGIVSAFNQPHFAGDTDTDYFLRCIRAVKERVRAALQPQEGGDA